MDDVPLAVRHNPFFAKLGQCKTGRVLQDWQQVKTLEGECSEPVGAGKLLLGKIHGRSPAQVIRTGLLNAGASFRSITSAKGDLEGEALQLIQLPENAPKNLAHGRL